MAIGPISRRALLALSAGAAMPGRLRAEQERMRQIGVLMGTAADDPETQVRAEAFTAALKEFGWTQGRNLRIHTRSPGPDRERLQAAVSELLSLAPDLILATTTPILAAVREQTRSVPVVFLNVTDPVGQGFVESLARPGGNVTGFTSFEFSMGGKWIELLKEAAPGVKRLALLFNPVTAPYVRSYIEAFQAAAPRFNVELVPTPIHDAAEIERAIEAFAGLPNGGLFVAPDITTARNRDVIIRLAAKHKLPAVYPYPYFAANGGLIAYGVDITDFFQRAAGYADRIFKGANPGSLPVQQPVKFGLSVNRRTAQALGITIPPTLLARADEVIE